MPNYLVSYDLTQPGRDYAALHEAIKRIANGYCKPLESLWVIGHTGNASAIRNQLVPFIDGDDKLFVVKLAGDWATWNVPQGTNDWLNKYMV